MPASKNAMRLLAIEILTRDSEKKTRASRGGNRQRSLRLTGSRLL
jgi:hypothetical protein